MTEKKTLYVGGLSEAISKDLLFSAFIPFGEVTDVQIARDPGNNDHKGFGFVEFEAPEDAMAAIDNMNHAEILGRTIYVSIANEQSVMKTRAIWEEDSFVAKRVADMEESESATTTTASN
mmetsp:Transcript_5873/g.9544  ORF Transcript_5873/g.9544 Transcript_5873/m.9544 type:complete len:120 (-) Transcript_5873:132-491(-)